MDRPREIRGPGSFIPHESDLYINENMTFPELFYTAQEVGQIIALVQKAEQASARRFYLGDLNVSHADSVSWRSLSDKLKGPSEGGR